MPKVLTSEQIKSYHAQGYHFPVNVLSDAEVKEFRRKLEAYEERTGGPLRGEMRHKSHLLFPWINELMRHPRILDAVEDVLGPNLLVWTTNFFIKEANDPGYVSWHQDATYWGLSSPDVCTAWIALSPANKVSGCMKFIAGTQKEQVKHRDTFHKDNLLTRGQEIAVEADESKAIYVELNPGQASLHHVLLFHGSEPNRSDDRRIGLAIRYIPTSVRQIVGDKDAASLVCAASIPIEISRLSRGPERTSTPRRSRSTRPSPRHRQRSSTAGRTGRRSGRERPLRRGSPTRPSVRRVEA